MRKAILVVFSLLMLTSTAFGHGTTASKADISVDEKLGRFVPGDAEFFTDEGNRVTLGALIDKPTIIAPVYLSCMHICPMLLNGLADVLGKMDMLAPGKDFRVITLSFDDKDTPAIARDKKRNYLKAIGRPFPADSWTFLTGDEANIRKLTDAVGFTFQRDGEHDFSHPVVLVVLAPGGKIVRYLYGTRFLPFAVNMALNEASQGKVGSTTSRVLQYCFSYDPQKHSYVFNILKVTGTVMVLFVGSFLVFLLKTTKKHRGNG